MYVQAVRNSMERTINGSFSSVEMEIKHSKVQSSLVISAVEEKIEASKVHWSELASNSEFDVEGENTEVFKTLQSDPTWGSFFKTFDDGEIMVGEKFAEGGQAEIYLVDWRMNPADRANRSIFEEEIEISKAHWTEFVQPGEVEDEDEDDKEDEDEDDKEDKEEEAAEVKMKEKEVKRKEEEEMKVRNKQVFKKLQENSPWGKSFFYEFEEGEMVHLAEEKFAEGAQAELYHAQIKWRNSDSQKLFLRGKDLLKDGNEYVLKVFKKETSLEQLKETLPQAMLKFHAMKIDSWLTRRYVCDIVCAILLPDGRFAFVLQREQTDLRKLIDCKKELQSAGGKRDGPFQNEVAENVMYEIARGMNWLHGQGIVHRDLKASNVLVRESGWNYCFVADYECSVGTMGTGFWRAPEILKAIKARNVKPELFTEAADVYAYGMTCYEILTGEIPLQGHLLSDVFVDKQKPKVPEHVDSWVGELMKSCWQFNPQDRPSFGEILEVLRRNSVAIQRHEKRAHPKACEWTLQKTEMIPIEVLKTIVSETRNQQTQHHDGAQVNWRSQYDNEYEPRSQHQSKWVLKIFKKGTLLQHIRLRIPNGLLELHADRFYRAKSGCSASEWEKPRFICDVLCATLLKDGRFAFLLGREHFDLGCLIARSLTTKEDGFGAPFPMAVAEQMMHDVACGVDWLHSYNIVHRDMKATNVLITEHATGNYQCYVCDYESSVGVIGTGFWRAPEILKAFKPWTIRDGMEMFTKASDVYSYGMTCYEILTGKHPFANHPIKKTDLLEDLVVNQGLRPEVPEYVDGWAGELLNRCWQSDPTARPSFWQILKLFGMAKENRMECVDEILGEAPFYDSFEALF